MNAPKKKRQSNIELLRIFSMILIIGHHFSFHGISTYVKDSLDINKYKKKVNFIFFFGPAGKIGVAIFFMISGYFYINKSNVNLTIVIYETIFYGVLTGIIGILFVHYGFKLRYDDTQSFIDSNISQILNPITGGSSYWFVSIYVLIISFTPIINVFLRKLKKIGYFLFLVLFWVLWYSIPYYYYYYSVFINLENGLFFYCLGGFIKLHLKKQDNLLFIFIHFFIALLGFYIASYYFLISYSIGYVISCFGTFRFFEGLNLGSYNFINLISQSTFSVYLIHDSRSFRDIIWKSINWNYIYQSKYFLLYAFIIIFSIFFVCIIIDIFQKKFLEPFVLTFINKVSIYLGDKFFKKEEEIKYVNVV